MPTVMSANSLLAAGAVVAMNAVSALERWRSKKICSPRSGHHLMVEEEVKTREEVPDHPELWIHRIPGDELINASRKRK